MLDIFRKQVEVFGFYRHLDFCPHSSSVMETAFGDSHDSFSPGEAIGGALRRSASDFAQGRFCPAVTKFRVGHNME